MLRKNSLKTEVPYILFYCVIDIGIKIFILFYEISLGSCFKY